MQSATDLRRQRKLIQRWKAPPMPNTRALGRFNAPAAKRPHKNWVVWSGEGVSGRSHVVCATDLGIMRIVAARAAGRDRWAYAAPRGSVYAATATDARDWWRNHLYGSTVVAVK